MLKLTLPVILFSIIINIPRFFETVIEYETFEATDDNNETVLIETAKYEVTNLRMNPDYIW